VVPRFGERCGGDGGDVADIDRVHPRVAGGGGQHAVFADRFANQGTCLLRWSGDDATVIA
jgi:hypothetical protein